MTVWKINPGAVSMVLEAVQTAQETLGDRLVSEELDPVASAVTTPSQGNPDGGRSNAVTGSVMASLNALFTSQAASIRTIQGHIAAGVYGVANATAEYNLAQAGMADATDPHGAAAHMQEEMFAAAASGDLSYFDTYGSVRPMDAQGDGV
ncbi:MAG: DUF6507 family protein [Beutenbergiaceae bacterium]